MIVVVLIREEVRAGEAVVLRPVVPVVLVDRDRVPSEAPVLRDVERQLVPVAAERLSSGLFGAPDDGGVVSAKVNWARLRPFELEPDAADYVPLRVTYSCPSPLEVLAVNFDLTVNAARMGRGGGAGGRGVGRPRMGLLLADGSNISPAIELPSMLPATLGAGERRTQTCLFIVGSQQAARFRLTYDGVPVATITPEGAPAAARSGL